MRVARAVWSPLRLEGRADAQCGEVGSRNGWMLLVRSKQGQARSQLSRAPARNVKGDARWSYLHVQ
eukprot:scaffold8226_cov114-Isochrysis_galbana.AAC.4